MCITRPARLVKDERGTALVIITFFMIALLGFAALSIDVAHVFREQRRAQIGTDAAVLAGVLKLVNSTPAAKRQAINEARQIAMANGVTGGEIAAGARGQYPGDIQVGLWDDVNRMFIPVPPNNNDAANAIRVPARRTVRLDFGRIVGLAQMTPFVSSVAIIGKFSVPYGVPACVLSGVKIGDIITLSWWRLVQETTPDCPNRSGSSSGNWGVLRVCECPEGGNSGRKWTICVLTNPCFVSVGQTAEVDTGFDGVAQAFKVWGDGAVYVLPVTTDFPSGASADVTVVDFIEVQQIGVGSGGGNNWQLTVRLLRRGLNPPKRTLVE